MPRPGEDRSDVGGAAQFNNIGPVPLSRSPAFPLLSDPSRFPAPAFPLSLTISDPSRFPARSVQLGSGQSFAHVVFLNFGELRANGISHPDMGRIEKLLSK